MEYLKYKVFFCGESGDRILPATDQPTIVFSPSADKWNDFSVRTYFEYKVVEAGRQSTSGVLHLAFVNGDSADKVDSPADLVINELRTKGTNWLEASELPVFFTLQQSMQSYRKLVSEYSPKGAEDVLVEMNDLVAISRKSRRPPWVRAAVSSRAFRLSFLRKAETFFAYHNAASILQGLAMESLGGMSTRYELEFRLPTFPNGHDIAFGFDFSSVLPKRMAVVIGKNGTGKSQSLAHFARFLLDGNSSLRDEHGVRPLVNRLLAISSPGEARETFPRFRRRSRIDYHHVHLSRYPFAKTSPGLGDAIVRLARSTESIRGKDRWELFCASIGEIIPVEELGLRSSKKKGALGVRGESRPPVPLMELRAGNEMERLERWGTIDDHADVLRNVDNTLVPLSSGQLTFIRFAAQACLFIENGTMVLFDEPETHLHPNFISDFVKLLDKLLAETGSLAILATHSAYFVREVAKSQVIVLRQTPDGQIEVVKPRLKTLGADIGEISHFVFEDRYFGSLLSQVRERLRNSPHEAGSILGAIEGEISTEALMSLQREIPTRGDAA